MQPPLPLIVLSATLLVSDAAAAQSTSRSEAPSGAAQADAETPDRKPEVRLLRIRVVTEDGKPADGAKVHVSVWTDEPFKANRDYVIDESGVVTTELPRRPEILRLWASLDGYVPLFAQWWPDRQPDGHRIPDEFTFKLPKGTVLSGLIRNEDGEPIEGAKVEVMGRFGGVDDELSKRPCFSVWLAQGDEARTTDSDGRWTLNNMPAGEYTVSLKVSHPDYVSDYQWGRLQSEQNVTTESLRAGTGTLVMPRGIRVTGTVTDSDGNPVPDATVVWGDDPYFQEGSQEVRTDQSGVYGFPPLPVGELPVTVMAEGWSPELKRIKVSEDAGPADFRLEPGYTLRLLFVDGAGKPVPGVSVSIRNWRGAKSLYNHKHPNVLDTGIPRAANDNGVYEWTWAPQDAVSYGFWKKGYREIESRSLIADDYERKITLQSEQ